ncbi:hypothetical protein OPV22_022022 [Ensete ventricosum]|uniref:Diacylglycerol O-acyltransferase n=1 Tax=Ensete ventricosum TaxID=4639 RepID=A0AAV8PBP4_ENSVE|nr:hypothetical protein OPV22_022022 [Ensete ventricosum]
MEFAYGGFAVDIKLSHVVFDGLGAAQYLTGVTEIARGHARPVATSIWCRDDIPSQPKLSPGHPLPSFEAFHFENSMFDIASDHIDAVKNQFWRETGHKCSIFDVVMAMTWQCRTWAICFDAHVDVHLRFAANTCHLLWGLLLQEGYYDNFVYPMGIRRKLEPSLVPRRWRSSS